MKGFHLTAFLALLIVALLFGCSGDDAELAGPSGRAIREDVTADDFLTALLSLDDLSSEYPYLESDLRAERTREDLLQDAFDPTEEAKDLDEFGWNGTWAATFADPDGLEPVWVASSAVNLYENSESASRALEDVLTDAIRETGMANANGTYLLSAEEFEVVNLGEESIGISLVLGSDPLTESFYMTSVGFRVDRLVVAAALFSLDDTDLSSEAVALAELLSMKVENLLAD